MARSKKIFQHFHGGNEEIHQISFGIAQLGAENRIWDLQNTKNRNTIDMIAMFSRNCVTTLKLVFLLI
jgi:hypothetical protein